MIENTHGFGYGLARFLVADREEVFDVAPWMTNQLRSRRPHANKTDRGDAELVALSALVFKPDTFRGDSRCRPVAASDDGSAFAGQEPHPNTPNQLKAVVRAIDPERAARLGRLRSSPGDGYNSADTVTTKTSQQLWCVRWLISGWQSPIRSDISRASSASSCHPVGKALMSIPGIGLIAAATIITEVRDPNRSRQPHAQTRCVGRDRSPSTRHQADNRLIVSTVAENRRFAVVIHRCIETQMAHPRTRRCLHRSNDNETA